MKTHIYKRNRLRIWTSLLLIGLFLPAALLTKSSVLIVEASSGALNNWWPVNGAVVTGTQPFKGMADGMDISQYKMYWQVDNGQYNLMSDNQNNYPHKESLVDVTGWSWHGSGPYTITFTAKDQNGNVISSKSFSISLEQKNAVRATQPVSPAGKSIQVWWPTDGVTVRGIQPIKAIVQGMNVNQYDMYWKIGDGSLIPLANDYSDYVHKQTEIDFTNWTWHGAGPYVIDLIAKSGGNIIAQTKVSVFNGAINSGTGVSVPMQTNMSVQTNVSVQTNTSVQKKYTNPLSGLNFYVDSNSNAAKQVIGWQSTRPRDAAEISKIAKTSQARWFGDWDGANIYNDVKSYVDAAAKTGTVPVMVLYNIPNRDMGSYSAGGCNDASEYATWISSVQRAIGGNKAVVILEPDALAQMDGLSSNAQKARTDMLKSAVKTLKSGSGTFVYLDAGNSSWQSVSTISGRLTAAGIADTDGFSLNVSNYYGLSENTQYGDQVSKTLGGKHFIVDTSRNGLGANGQWCNPSGRALGVLPATNTGDSLADAFLWLKSPGESDGACNGGPNAGVWWPDYALGLAQRAVY